MNPAWIGCTCAQVTTFGDGVRRFDALDLKMDALLRVRETFNWATCCQSRHIQRHCESMTLPELIKQA